MAGAAAAAACGMLPSPAAACGALKHARAHHAPHPAARAPLIVGDSTMIFAAPVLGSLGLEADAHGCRQFGQGVGILAARRHAGSLPRFAILALGANGAVGDAGISRALRAVGRARVLGLVTPRNSGSTAGAMRRAAHRHPDRIVLFDWARYSRAHGRGWFGGDGLHVNQAGARAFARFVRRGARPLLEVPRGLDVPRRLGAGKRCGTVHRSGGAYAVFVARGRSRVTCRRARAVVRAPRFRPVTGWRYFEGLGRRPPWSGVYTRASGRTLVTSRAKR